MIDEVNTDLYHENAESLLDELDELHAEISGTIIKYNLTEFVTFHSSFSYFAQRYGLTQHSLIGENPHSEPTAGKIVLIIELVRNHEITVIYSEPQHNTRLLQMVAGHMENGRILVLDPLDTISVEELMMGTTYLEKMRDNLKNLKEGLKNE